MFNSENSKFKAGDSVVLKNSQYRGGWLEHNLAGGREVDIQVIPLFIRQKQLLPEF